MIPPTEKLVALAEVLIEQGRTEPAAFILAFVLAHPATPTAIHHQADLLFDELEASICPRVIWDARQFAQAATQTDVIAYLAAAQADLPA